MKPADNLEKRIRRMNEAASQDLDERVIADIRAAFDGPPPWSFSRPLKLLAAAAVVALAVLLAITRLPQEPEPTRKPRAPLSVGEMVTVTHLSATYRRGGMQALDALCEETADRVDLKPRKLTVDKLIAELNGT